MEKFFLFNHFVKFILGSSSQSISSILLFNSRLILLYDNNQDSSVISSKLVFCFDSLWVPLQAQNSGPREIDSAPPVYQQAGKSSPLYRKAKLRINLASPCSHRRCPVSRQWSSEQRCEQIRTKTQWRRRIRGTCALSIELNKFTKEKIISKLMHERIEISLTANLRFLQSCRESAQDAYASRAEKQVESTRARQCLRFSTYTY